MALVSLVGSYFTPDMLAASICLALDTPAMHSPLLQRILTPSQSAKFVVWVSKNRACVHMLEQLWDKLHGNGSPDC